MRQSRQSSSRRAEPLLRPPTATCVDCIHAPSLSFLQTAKMRRRRRAGGTRMAAYWRGAAVAFGAACLTAGLSAPALAGSAPAASTLVETEYGWVQGQTDGRVNAWLGIHYAGSPAGQYRWTPAAPSRAIRHVRQPAPGDGVRDTLSAEHLALRHVHDLPRHVHLGPRQRRQRGLPGAERLGARPRPGHPAGLHLDPWRLQRLRRGQRLRPASAGHAGQRHRRHDQLPPRRARLARASAA